jgi:DNA-binding winged helix-turn-helix (wHTH) protein
MRDGQLVPLTPKAVDTLVALIAAAGRIMEKEELIKTVWPDSFVEEGGLARNVSALRKALGDTEEERYIETIPKRGYRFVAPVTILDPAQEQPESTAAEPVAKPEADPPPGARTASGDGRRR